jgi:acyl-CoA synthetase (AMP-forming)/AMP-acid ligase II
VVSGWLPLKSMLSSARHPAILEVAVAGVPDEHWGEIVTAFVVPKPGEVVAVDELRRFCAGKLTAYKHPRHVIVIESLPRTATTGQIQRRVLTELALRQAQSAEAD